MAHTVHVYGKFLSSQLDGTESIDLDNDTIKCMLCDNGHTPDYDAHDYRDDVTADEVSGTGYTAGGVTVTGFAISLDAANNECEIDCGDVTFSSVTLTNAQYAIFYKAKGGASSADPLICVVVLDAAQNPAGVDLVFQIAAEGLFKISYG